MAFLIMNQVGNGISNLSIKSELKISNYESSRQWHF